MTYLALARKWRPRTFADVAGQTHVVRALENALGSGRVHHAFLFTGTRGVGKTTIARILVKALNCERGVTPSPCGECRSCVAIDEGRFVDFIELDAASRTGVDDTRELLENAQYTPASGRYKVYLVDEVHMLSKAAFNALLKTLEEPPAHVKFLLATTDPQKIPVTVLSRCLQFNLKRLPAGLIAERLVAICRSEGVTAEAPALGRLARAAEGSMRDALSLLDQGLAYGNGTVTDADSAAMLGSLDRSRVQALLEALARRDGQALFRQIRALDELAPDYEDVLGSLATRLQQMALVQIAGPEALADDEDRELVGRLAAEVPAAIVQLMYQIAVQGRRDMALAPDPRTGFEMALLRVLAFQPGAVPQAAGQGHAAPAPARAAAVAGAPAPSVAEPSLAASSSLAGPDDWPEFVRTLSLEGAAQQLAVNTSLESRSPTGLRLTVGRRNAHLLTEGLKARMVAALQERLGRDLRVEFQQRDEGRETAASRQARSTADDLHRARQTIERDQNVTELTELFGAELVADSIRRVSDRDTPDQ